MTKIEIVKRLYKNYTKKYLKNILIAFIFSLLLAGSTSSVIRLGIIGHRWREEHLALPLPESECLVVLGYLVD